MKIYDAIDLIGYARRVSVPLLAGCEVLMDPPLVGDVQETGLFCGFQIVQGKAARTLWGPSLKVGTMVQDRAHPRGLYLRSIPPERISFMPPLVIAEDETAEATAILKAALDDVWAKVKGRA